MNDVYLDGVKISENLDKDVQEVMIPYILESLKDDDNTRKPATWAENFSGSYDPIIGDRTSRSEIMMNRRMLMIDSLVRGLPDMKAAPYSLEGNILYANGERLVQKIKGKKHRWYFILHRCYGDMPVEDKDRMGISYQFSPEWNRNVIEVPYDPKSGELTVQRYFSRTAKYFRNMMEDFTKDRKVMADRRDVAVSLIRMADSELASEISMSDEDKKTLERARSLDRAIREARWK